MSVEIIDEAESFPELQESSIAILKSFIQSKENANEYTEKWMEELSRILPFKNAHEFESHAKTIKYWIYKHHPLSHAEKLDKYWSAHKKHLTEEEIAERDNNTKLRTRFMVSKVQPLYDELLEWRFPEYTRKKGRSVRKIPFESTTTKIDSMSQHITNSPWRRNFYSEEKHH